VTGQTTDVLNAGSLAILQIHVKRKLNMNMWKLKYGVAIIVIKSLRVNYCVINMKKRARKIMKNVNVPLRISRLIEKTSVY
jgi:hypothetical protein